MASEIRTVYAAFERFPEFEGIKTRRHTHLPSALQFERFPEFEGIKTRDPVQYHSVNMFERFPAFEGIKTLSLKV